MMRDVRYAVIHQPGPGWQHGRPINEQPGVQAHVQHYARWLEAGKLEWGGPFLDEAAGGMMVPAAELTEDEVREYAGQDPSVIGGLLTFEVRPWLIGMRRLSGPK